MNDFIGEYYIVHENHGHKTRNWTSRILIVTFLLLVLGIGVFLFTRPEVDLELMQDNISQGEIISARALTKFSDKLIWEVRGHNYQGPGRNPTKSFK